MKKSRLTEEHSSAFCASRTQGLRRPQQARDQQCIDGRRHDALLNETLFISLAQARAVLAARKHDYNNVLPHGSLGDPTKAAKRCAIPGLRARPIAPPSPSLADEAWDSDQHPLWGTYTSAAHERNTSINLKRRHQA